MPPDCTATVVSTFRCAIIGLFCRVEMLDVVVWLTLLTSWTMSSVTRPPELTRGVTARMTPVSRYSIELTIGASAEIVLCDDCVEIGTWSPTCSVAVSLSRTNSCGADITLTVVT